MPSLNRFLCFVMLWTLSACGRETYVDVSKDPNYAKAVGTRYEVTGRLFAYGIRQHSQAPIEHVTLMPPPGVEGSTIVSLGEVPPGTVVTVVAVHKTNRVFDDPHTFIVSVDRPATVSGYPTMIERFRGNEGQSGPLSLNPVIYKPLPQPR